MDEEEFKEKIKGLFSVLQDEDVDFDFVKSCYGQIVTPKIATGVKFSAARVLSISGQGSIYIRPKQDFPVSNESDESSAQGPLTPLPFDSFGVDGGSVRSSVCNSNGASAPGPSRTVSEEDKLQQLVELFPNKSTDLLHQALNDHVTISGAALSLSSAPTYAVSNDDDSDVLSETSFHPSDERENSLKSLLQELEKGMSTEKEKLKIDEDDILNDGLSYYKDPNFDPKKRLRVIYRGQPAVDTGGVTRQFFTKLLQVISDMFFHGSSYKSPVYNAGIVASGMMKYFGTIIVHSILQGGPGFPVFSPSVYCYLATGDIDSAMQTMTIQDCSEPMKHFIKKVLCIHFTIL